jgi:hypothetical protein
MKLWWKYLKKRKEIIKKKEIIIKKILPPKKREKYELFLTLNLFDEVFFVSIKCKKIQNICWSILSFSFFPVFSYIIKFSYNVNIVLSLVCNHRLFSFEAINIATCHNDQINSCWKFQCEKKQNLVLSNEKIWNLFNNVFQTDFI